MKLRFFIFATLTLFLVACSNEDVYDFSTVNVSQIKTRSLVSTKSLVQERLNDLSEIYGIPLVLSENTDPMDVTDEFFEFIEQGLKQKKELSEVREPLQSQDSRFFSSDENGQISDLVVMNDLVDETSIKAVALKSSTTVPEYGSFTDEIKCSYWFAYRDLLYPYDDNVKVNISWNTEKNPNIVRFNAEDSYFAFPDKPTVNYYVTNEMATIPTPHFSYSYDVAASYYNNETNKFIKSQILVSIVGQH